MTTGTIVRLVQRLQRLRRDPKNYISPEMASVAARYCFLAARVSGREMARIGSGGLYESLHTEAHISLQVLKDKAPSW